MKKDTTQKIAFISAIIFLAALSRILPHPFNFSPIGAMCLVGGAYFSNRIFAVILPLLAVFFSDLILNNFVYGSDSFVLLYDGFYWPYGTFALIALMGSFSLNKVTMPRVIGSSLGASVIFFLLTNFACWPGSTLYTQDFNGLMACYAAGIPFFGGTIAGDLFYSAILFGAVELAKPRLTFLKQTI